MRRLIEFPLESGTFAIIEVNEQHHLGFEPAASTGDLLERAGKTFDEALEGVKPVIHAIVNKLRDYNASVDQTEIEFGLKVGAKAELIIASADSEATFKIKLAWSARKPNAEDTALD